MKQFIFIFLSALLISTGFGWGAENPVIIPQMTVSGEAAIFKPADQMELTIDVMTEGKDAKQAVEDNTRMMNSTLENLAKLGITKEEYQTSRYQVQPVYHIPTKEEDNQTQKTIDHYIVHHSLAIKTQKLNLKNAIIGAAIEGGANQITSLVFNSLNPQSFREEAIATAAKNALDNAKALAVAANVKIVRILSLTVEHLQDQSRNSVPRFAMAKVGGGSVYEPTLDEGPVEIYAVVNLVVEIGPL